MNFKHYSSITHYRVSFIRLIHVQQVNMLHTRPIRSTQIIPSPQEILTYLV